MRRRLLPSLIVLACAGCAAHQAVAWVPQLVVRGQLAQDVGEGTRGAQSGLGWRVEGSLRWDLSRPSAPREAVEVPPRDTRSASGCAHPATCAWERRESARALRSALRGSN